MADRGGLACSGWGAGQLAISSQKVLPRPGVLATPSLACMASARRLLTRVFAIARPCSSSGLVEKTIISLFFLEIGEGGVRIQQFTRPGMPSLAQ